MEKICGRFAPTPSGRFHLGNVFSSLLAWLLAKSQKGKMILRIEDLDRERCPVSLAEQMARDLEWLGLTWDEGAYLAGGENYFQSRRAPIYETYFEKLKSLTYPCFCSRAELHAAEAPHLSDGRFVYDGRCRSLTAEEIKIKMKKRPPAFRLRAEGTIKFTDGHYGPQEFDLAEENGDFIIRRSDGVFAYQLAAAIDDALMGVNEVVRGRDLLSSSPLQIYILNLLNLPAPNYFHVPLLLAPEGRKMSKRDGDLNLDALKRRGSSEPVIGYLAYLAGQIEKPEPVTAESLVKIFNPAKIPLGDITIDGGFTL